MIFRATRAFACGVAAIAILAALPAEAGERRHRDGHHHRQMMPVEQHVDGAEMLTAAIFGLVTGVIIAGTIDQSYPSTGQNPTYREPAWRHPQAHSRPRPDRTYFPPAPPHRPSVHDYGR